jgi:uncharacterized protein with PIN domain
MIEAEERDDVRPVCPHCKIEITRILLQRVSAILGKRYVYYCSQCRSVLGISHRKGFWMG